MISKTVRGGYDSWVGSGKPAKPHGDADFLTVKSNEAYAFVFMKSPVPRGAIVVEATLQLRCRGASGGARTVKARRVAAKWLEKKVTWNNKPGVTGSNQPTAAIGTVADGDLVELDVKNHLQTIANSGEPHYGWRIETTAGTAHKFYGLDAGRRRPLLVVRYTWKPDAPSNLTSGGLSLAKPFLQFDFNDMSGRLDLAAIQIQIDPDANGTTPAWDSGEVVTGEPGLDLATTSYPGLADTASTKWRARAKTTDGYWSDWSLWVSFSRTAKGVLTLNAPGAAPNDIVTESTPPILWTFNDQVAYRVKITPAGDRRTVLHDTQRTAGADQSWSPPKGVIKTVGSRYSVMVETWDSKPRVGATGDPVSVQVWRDFTFAYDGSKTPAATLSVAQVGMLPCAELTFTRATPPDAWAIERDGVIIDTDIDPEDLLTTGTTYVYRDWTAPAFKNHTYRAVPIVNGKSAAGGPTATVKLRIAGLWVVDPVNEWRFNLLEVSPNLNYGESSEVAEKFTTVARKIGSIRGLEGDPAGVLVTESEFDPRPLKEQLADVYAIKERPLRRYRVAVADVNFPAMIGNVNPAPSSEFLEGIEQRAMSFSAWQDGELPFKAQA